MAELKTQKTKVSAAAFINSVENPQRRADAKELLRIFKEATGMKPAIWGTSIVGYGSFHYKSERSTQEGNWPLTGFSPRKANLTVYIMSGFKGSASLLKKLGKHKVSGGSCVYISKLSDIDETVLKALIKQSVGHMQKRYPEPRST